MRKLIVPLLFIAAAASAQLSELDRTAAAINGQEARFTHKFTPKGFKTAQVESGSVIFGKLPMMRWSYSDPEQKLFVFDGTRSWFYVPDDKQVTVADIDDRRRAELPFLLIGDPEARNRHFIVGQKARGSKVTTTLQPRSAAALIRQVAIVSDAATHRIDSIEYSDREGNRTVFSFSGYHPARATGDTFRFAPPAGVQVVRAE
jgi:outer membrane lipoprotein carrier protein